MTNSKKVLCAYEPHHFIYFPQITAERVSEDSAWVWKQTWLTAPAKLCLKCFQPKYFKSSAHYAPCFPCNVTVRGATQKITSEIIWELETIAREMVKRYLTDFFYIQCAICRDTPINFSDILGKLANDSICRRDTSELLTAGLPVGFVCCDCFDELTVVVE